MRGNSLKVCQGSSDLILEKCFVTERVVRHWNKLTREVVESVSLEVSKREMSACGTWEYGLGAIMVVLSSWLDR